MYVRLIYKPDSMLRTHTYIQNVIEQSGKTQYKDREWMFTKTQTHTHTHKDIWISNEYISHNSLYIFENTGTKKNKKIHTQTYTYTYSIRIHKTQIILVWDSCDAERLR